MNRIHLLSVLGVITACLMGGSTLLGAKSETEPQKKTEPAAEAKTEPAAEAKTETTEEVRPGTHVGWLTLRGALRDGPAPMTIFGVQGSGKGTLGGVIKQLTHVADDAKYKGVVIHLDGAGVSLSQIYDLQLAMERIRSRGKKVLIFAEAYSTMTYRLACAADKILMIQNGGVELSGLSAEEMYLAGLLEKVGVKADMVQVGQYKGADEQFMRKGPSMAWNENMDNLMDDLYTIVIDGIAKTRGSRKAYKKHLGSREKIEQLMRDTLLMTDKQLIKRGVIDHVVTRELKDVYNFDEKKKRIDVAETVFEDHRFEWDEDMGLKMPVVQINNPMLMMQQMLQPTAPSISRDTIAVVHCNGAIHSGDSGAATMFSGDTIGSRTIVKVLRDAKRNPLVKAVVLRINSPGGSALASEVIWQATRQVIEEEPKKPVFISIGSMAASGGYYMACAGDQIYAAPNSIIGSIGVVGGKITMGGLYDWAGIGIYRRSRGPLSDMFNSVEPFNKEQRIWLNKALTQIYSQFTDRVMAGRKGQIKDISKVAQGRLFTGRQCVANGLIDKIGGLDVVLADLAQKVNLKPGQYDVVDFPEQPSALEMLEQMISIRSPAVPVGMNPQHAAIIRTARTLMGERNWQQAATVMSAMMLLRQERALTLMPVVITVK